MANSALTRSLASLYLVRGAEQAQQVVRCRNAKRYPDDVQTIGTLQAIDCQNNLRECLENCASSTVFKKRIIFLHELISTPEIRGLGQKHLLRFS